MDILSPEQINQGLAGLPGWEIREGKVWRQVTFPDFATAFAFMTKVAAVAEELQHHPDWRNVYNRVELSLSTHEVNGITEKDVQLAGRISALI